jgi:hypothetical protein
MKSLIGFILPLIAVTAIGQRVASLPSGSVVDLSHPFDATTVYWPTIGPLPKLSNWKKISKASPTRVFTIPHIDTHRQNMGAHTLTRPFTLRKVAIQLTRFRSAS